MRSAFAAGAAVAALACGGSAPAPDPQSAQAAPPPESEAPVALNPDVPIAYPVALFEQKIEGDVVLRLFVDSTGRLLPESTRVAESSNYPALDSAALAGSATLRFAPAKRHGIPVATAFLQPVEFRQATAAPTRTPAQVPAPPAPADPRPPAARPQAPPVQVRADTTRPRTDTTPVRTDTTRARADTTRPPPPLPPPSPPPTDTGAAAH